MADVLDVLKNGKPGAARERYIREIIAERLTGSALQRYVSQPMLDGIEREPEAREMYEAETGSIVTLAGFVRHPTIEFCGASPDGLVDDCGLVEIKCPTDATHVEWLLAKAIPDKHIPQMLLQLACTRRSWCDFVAFNPNFRKPAHRLMIRRFTPEPAAIQAVEDSARAFLAEVDQTLKMIG
jgi:exodeoxyribonuclease (lambda-induced)